MKMSYSKHTPSGLIKSKDITISTRLILQEAEKQQIKWQAIPGTEILELKYKNKKRYFFHQVSPQNSPLAHYVCNHKNITNNLLRFNQISVPKGFFISKTDKQEYWLEIYDALKKPLVVKPSTGAHGDCVFVGVKTKEKYLQLVKKTLAYSLDKNSGTIVEEMFSGHEFRILATKDKVIGVTNRVPANVVGDGKSTIKQLIKIKNSNSKRGEQLIETPWIKIKADQEVLKNLRELGLNLDSVPNKDQIVFLRKNSNISTGGDSVDITDQVDPSVKKIALQVMQAIPGLTFAGIDFMTKDITKPQNKNSYVIIEVNDSPGLSMQDMPFLGKNRHAAREFLYLLFEELRP